MRALDRQGLDPQAKEKIERELSTAFRDMRKQREAEEKQRKIEEEMERRRLAEEAAEEEAAARKAADEEDWAAFASNLRASLHLSKGDEAPGTGPDVVSAVELTLHKSTGNNQKEAIPARAQVPPVPTEPCSRPGQPSPCDSSAHSMAHCSGTRTRM